MLVKRIMLIHTGNFSKQSVRQTLPSRYYDPKYVIFVNCFDKIDQID